MANEIGGISQKEYLQKYLPTNNEDKKKKKKFKVLSSSRVKRSQIIDDDIDIKNMQPLDDDDVELYQLDEDAPQIAGIIDERPAEIQAQEYYNDQKRWKVFASGDADGNITVVENEVKKVEEKEGTALKKDGTVVKRRKIQGDGVEKNYEKIIKTTLGLKSKKTALYNDLESSKQGDPSGTKQEKVISSSNKNRSHHNSDISPPRRKPVNSDSDASPPRKSSHRSRRHSDSDLSSPIVSSHKKKESNDSDASPLRKSSHRSRKHSDSDPSPQRVSSHKKKETNDSDVSPPRKSSHRSRKHSDSDLSPPRPSSYKNREDTDVDSRKFFSKSRKDTKPDSSFYKTSHKSRSDSDSDPSPPRKSSTYRHSSPANKNIKTDKKHSHLVGWEKSYKSSSRQRDRNLSPQLDNSKHNNNSKSARDGDRNPSDKKRNKSSPVRKTSKESDTDFSPPRKSQKIRKHSSDSDLTPPRQLSYKKYDSGSHSTKSKYDHKHSRYSRQSDEYDSDTSIKNKSSKRQANSRHQNSRSPKMNDDRQRRDFTQKIIKDKSSKRRKHSDSVSSDDVPSDKKKVQRINERYKETYDDRKEQHNKPKQSQDRSPKQSRDGKMKTTLEGKKAGLQDSSAMKKELVELKNRENQMFAQMDASISGLGAAPVVRDRKTGRKRDLEKEKERKEEKAAKAAVKEEKYSRWGKGLKQVEDAEQRLADTLKEMSKPLARYADDKDLDDFLKAQDREGDPMLDYIRSKQKESTSLGGSKPVYKGAFMPNRFGIHPGHRWDGVDRSNGFEKKWFVSKNARKAVEEEAYKWSTSDM